jgi:DNA-binding transcriptional ArsR family regulator
MQDFMDISRALSDENRVRALMALRDRELCVCQIIELLGLAPSTVSKHMSILRQARLVESRKQGRWIYYRLANDETPARLQEAIDWVCHSLSNDPRILIDSNLLKEILNKDPEELCKFQNKS